MQVNHSREMAKIIDANFYQVQLQACEDNEIDRSAETNPTLEIIKIVFKNNVRILDENCAAMSNLDVVKYDCLLRSIQKLGLDCQIALLNSCSSLVNLIDMRKYCSQDAFNAYSKIAFFKLNLNGCNDQDYSCFFLQHVFF